MTDKSKFYTTLRGSNMRERILRMQAVDRLHKLFLQDANQRLKSLVHLSRNLFDKNFTSSIRALLKNFPADFVDDKGVKFWTAPKMCPTVYEYDSNQQSHLDFIFHTTNIYCWIFGME